MFPKRSAKRWRSERSNYNIVVAIANGGSESERASFVPYPRGTRPSHLPRNTNTKATLGKKIKKEDLAPHEPGYKSSGLG